MDSLNMDLLRWWTNNGRDANSATIDTGELPSLTLEALLRTMQELEAILPEQLYKTHRYVPRTKDGEPFFASIPEFDWPNGDKTGRSILFVHPDNLPLLRLKAKGICRLVEWQP